jgi:hypothetical protein
MRLFFMSIMIVLLCIGAAPVFAVQGTSKDTPGEKPGTIVEIDMKDVGSVLLVFLVLSVVFEVALTPLFNWRVFMARFEGEGYKIPITVALAFIVFWGYGLDIISDLLTAMNKPIGVSLGGQILTALLIAGGSSGVFQIFTKLKIRMEPGERQEKTEEARRKRADDQAKAEEAKRKLADEKAKVEEARRKLADEKAKAEEARRKLADEKAKVEEARRKLADEKAKAEGAKKRTDKE